MKKKLLLFSAVCLAVLLSAVGAMAGGTLTATFIYNGGAGDQPLSGAYAYLHVYPQGSPIMEKYFRKAQYILGPSDANGNFLVSVPDGTYRVMLIRRAPLGSTPASAYGPPKVGDYIWFDYGAPVTVASGSTTALGSVYASIFGQGGAAATISGTVTEGGDPKAGWFVVASSAPFVPGYWYWSLPAQTGIKYPAPALTDQNGNYTINLSSPGTYFLYAMPSPAYYYNAPANAFPLASCSSCEDSSGTYYSSCDQCFANEWGIACHPYCPLKVDEGALLTGVAISNTTNYP